jgi:hypothetical protein
MLAGMGVGSTGCTESTGTKEVEKTTTPGGTATETRQIKIDKTGENPPAAPSAKRP